MKRSKAPRDGLAVLLVAAAFTGGIVLSPRWSAAAETGPGGSWTQLHNEAGYPTFPDCRDTAHGNGPCVMWPRDTTGKNWAQVNNGCVWSNTYGRCMDIHQEFVQAISELTSLPYRSPKFQNLANPCDFCVVIYSGNPNPDDGRCSEGGPTAEQGPAITQAKVTVFLRNQTASGTPVVWEYTHSDHPYMPPGTSLLCDLRAAVRHELGHTVGEGHSTLTTDLMCTPCDTNGGQHEYYDTDFQSGLNTMYGPNGSGGGGGGCAPIYLPAVPLPRRC